MKTRLFILLTAMVLLSCNQEGDQKNGTNIKINDVDIEFDQCGKEDTTLLFVHGWCINKEYWNSQKNYFCDKRLVVVTSLPYNVPL